MNSNISKLTGEAIGTFALCFIGAGAICLKTQQQTAGVDLLGIALAHGLILSIVVSATMNVSGGHINPAVTLAMLATKRINGATAVQYILAQLAGSVVAGIFVYMIFKDMIVPVETKVVSAAGLGTPVLNTSIGIGMFMGILIEALMTFLLVFAIFGTAVDPRAPKIGGFGIGLTVAADILLGGPLTGAAMNPARTFGTGLIANLTGNLGQFWSQHLVYWVGPVVGAVLAAVLYDALIMEKAKGKASRG